VTCNTLHSRLLDSVDFVLCIDTVGAADEINLHVSRPLKDEITKRMYGALESAAADMQPPLPFALHQRKIDLSKNITGLEAWHHEVIPRSRPNLRLLAATLSSQSAFNTLSRASILDRHPPALQKMNRDFEFLTRAVSKMLYAPHASPTVLRSPAFLSSSEFIRVASETVASSPRSAAHTSPPSPLLDALAALMAAGPGEMSKQTLRIDGPIVHYTAQVVTMQVFQAAATYVELTLSALVFAYCVALFVHLRGAAAAFKMITGIFKGSAKGRGGK